MRSSLGSTAAKEAWRRRAGDAGRWRGRATFNGARGWDQVFRMKIRVGFEMIYDFPQPTPLIAVLGTHFTRASDIIVPDHLTTSPPVPITLYRDGFGHRSSRLRPPIGRMPHAAHGLGRHG